MENIPAIVAKMESLRSSFGKSELRVIDYIVEHPDEVIAYSVADLAEASGVSDATVVRASKKLGLSGFYELKLALAKSMSSPIETMYDRVNPEDSTEQIMDKLFRNAMNTLKYTHDVANTPAMVEAAADMILSADRVYIFGMGNSAAIAMDMQHKLNRIGVTAMAVSDPHIQITVAAYSTERDVVFAISHSGSSKDVIESVKVAKEQGARIISLTNLGHSPLSKLSTISLHTASEETKYKVWAQSSRVSQLVLIDTIYTIISNKKPDIDDGFHQLDALKVKKY